MYMNVINAVKYKTTRPYREKVDNTSSLGREDVGAGDSGDGTKVEGTDVVIVDGSRVDGAMVAVELAIGCE